MESLHYLLMKSHLMLSKKILAEAAKIGLTAGQPKVLDFLRVHEEADQKTIASYCEIEQAKDLVRVICADDPLRIAHVEAVHSDQEIVIFSVCLRKLSRPFPRLRVSCFAPHKLEEF